MGGQHVAAIPFELENELAAELAQLALEESAPHELDVFPEVAAEYFADPEAVLNPARREEDIGFGLEFALLTPYVLSVAVAVVRFLAALVGETVKEESKPVLARLVRQLLRRPGAAGADPPSAHLSEQQARQVREVAYVNAKGLGLDDARATLLADSIVGGVLTGG
jgi:hypothetical protein